MCTDLQLGEGPVGAQVKTSNYILQGVLQSSGRQPVVCEVQKVGDRWFKETFGAAVTKRWSVRSERLGTAALERETTQEIPEKTPT